MSPLRGFPRLLIFLCAAAQCAGTTATFAHPSAQRLTKAISKAKTKHTQTCALICRRCKGAQLVGVAGLPPTLRQTGGCADRDRGPALRHGQPAGRPRQSCEKNSFLFVLIVAFIFVHGRVQIILL